MSHAPIDSPETLPGWIMPWPAFEVDWARAALLLIDIQNYCCHPEMGLMRMISERFPDVAHYYVARIATVVANTRRLLDAFREARRQVVYTRHGALLPDGRDMIVRRRRRDREALERTDAPALWAKGSPEHEIVDQLAPVDGELVIDKNTSSPFHSTGIDALLCNMKLETLVVAGMATDMCVETTARDAADRGYNVIVVEDATATFFPEHHRHALSAVARVYGKISHTEHILDELGRQ